MTPAFTIAHRDDMERAGDWSLCRRALGLGSFGLGLVEIPAGGSIPSHDETERDQEEVFFVVSGSPTLLIEDEAHLVPAGTFARLAPELRRQVVNTGTEPATVLIVSAPTDSGYVPMRWN